MGDKLSVAFAWFDSSSSSIGVDIPCCRVEADVPGASAVAFLLRDLLLGCCFAVSSLPACGGLCPVRVVFVNWIFSAKQNLFILR